MMHKAYVKYGVVRVCGLASDVDSKCGYCWYVESSVISRESAYGYCHSTDPPQYQL